MDPTRNDQVSDLFNILPNPDKSDDSDPDLMLITPTSNYHSASDINNLTASQPNNSLFMFHCNIRSLPKNLHLLDDLLYTFHTKPNIIAVTETRLKQNTVDNVDLTGYDLYHTDSPTSAGGTALYISSNLKAMPRPDLELKLDLVESTWIEIPNTKTMKNTIIGCLYRHPSSNVNDFTNEIQRILKLLDRGNPNVYILGDINIDLLKFSEHPPTEDYLNMIFSFNYLPLITKPTRLTDHTATLIDHIYTNNYQQATMPGIATIDISDHLPIFCLSSVQAEQKQKNLYYRDYTLFNNNNYLNDISSIDWEDIFSKCVSIHDKMEQFINQLKSITNKHAPIKKVSKSKIKQYTSKPWITNGILKSIKHKQKMYKTHYLSKNPIKIDKYKKYCNSLNKLKTISKSQYYQKQFELSKNNLKYIWQLLGSLINRKTKKTTYNTYTKS